MLVVFMTLMVLTALPFVRRRVFEVFYYLHISFCCVNDCMCLLSHWHARSNTGSTDMGCRFDDSKGLHGVFSLRAQSVS
jgi:hypothetical protein